MRAHPAISQVPINTVNSLCLTGTSHLIFFRIDIKSKLVHLKCRILTHPIGKTVFFCSPKPNRLRGFYRRTRTEGQATPGHWPWSDGSCLWIVPVGEMGRDCSAGDSTPMPVTHSFIQGGLLGTERLCPTEVPVSFWRTWLNVSYNQTM